MRLSPVADLHINAFTGAIITELGSGITNGVVEKKIVNGQEVFYLSQRPSIDVFEDASALSSGSRGRGIIYWDLATALYIVNNDNLYKSSQSNSKP